MTKQPNNVFLKNLIKCSVEHINANAKWLEREKETEWFQEEIYIPTKLDTKLKPDLLKLKFPLVFLSGTPGSGKTQFLKKFRIELLKNDYETKIIGHDARITETFQKDDKILHIKHDATQVESQIEDASEKLGELLAADWSDTNFEKNEKRAFYVIGINQGVLQRLCDHDGFQKLGKSIRKLSDPRVLVVDLSKRSAVSPRDHQDAFVTYLLLALTDKKHWEDRSEEAGDIETCYGCELVETGLCPVLTNIQCLRLREKNPWARIHDIFEMNHYISGNITTFRDVLAILAKSIAGYPDYYKDRAPCEFIRTEASIGDFVSLMNLSRLLIYNSMFSDRDPYGEYLDQLELSKGDRERHVFFGFSGAYFVSSQDDLGTIAMLDPARSDSDIFRDQDDKIFNFPRELLDHPKGHFERTLFQCLKNRLETLDIGEAHDELSRLNRLRAKDWLLYCLVRLARRRTFVLGERDCKEISQYEHANSFSRTIKKLTEGSDEGYNRQLSGDLKIALSALSDTQSSGTMKVSYGIPDSKIKAFLDFEASLKVFVPKPTVPYIEYFPSEIHLAVSDNQNNATTEHLAPLKIDIEVWECLRRAEAGYSSSYLGIERAKTIEGFLHTLRSIAWDFKGCKLEIKQEDTNVIIYKDRGRPVIR